MLHLIPDDARLLATAVADTLLVSADETAAASAPIFWHWARELAVPMLADLADVRDAELSRTRSAMLADAGGPATREAFVRRLCELAWRNPAETAQLFQRAWAAECNSRLGYHLGAEYRPEAQPVPGEELAAPSRRPGGPGPGGAAVLVVVPFRDSTAQQARIRNLLACLRALDDQSAARADYHIAVVESDEEPRWRDLLSEHCDSYLFAPKAGAFNKSWTVNVGVRHTAGDYDLVCLLDADVLPDRDFIARNIRRFMTPGTQAVLPFRDAVFLDAPSTDRAVRERVLEHRGDIAWERARGYTVRRNPGLCFWIRREVFALLGGLDERFEGWGGEDTDFALRVSARAALDRHDDRIAHQHHESSAPKADGAIPNSHIVKMTWPSDSDFGRLDRFTSVMDGEAAAMERAFEPDMAAR